MALEYKTHTRFETLAPILEEYAAWFGNIAYRIAYLDDLDGEIQIIVLPNSFKNWIDDPETKESISNFLLEDMSKAHDDMVKVGGMIVNTLKDKKKPAKRDFADFKNLYNAFLMRLRRVEKDNVYDGSGVDSDTGLRSAAVLKDDLKEEMERLGRQGNPFSLVVSRIDFFAGNKNQSKAIEIVVRCIKKCMRSFDDAYYLGQGEFLLSLKHADKIGGKAAINRLQAYLTEEEENKDTMTMSYCLTEPSVGDDISEVMDNMRQDLIDHMNEANIVLELTEVSALERFAAKL